MVDWKVGYLCCEVKKKQVNYFDFAFEVLLYYSC